SGAPLYDVTARKAHQWTMVALIALGFIIGDRGAAIPVALAGAIMLAGRFWWPADLVRQAVWRALEPWGILRRRDVAEDHDTRRVARVLGGTVWLVAALLLVVGASVPAWIIAGLVAVMVVLDASVDFCAWCFASAQLTQRRA
ncbi:MAG TPA: DUF4395 family protein, partial [Chloroflexota bacterium]|nr:DUF4395 family protein [Chloroflexota bacterium]